MAQAQATALAMAQAMAMALAIAMALALAQAQAMALAMAMAMALAMVKVNNFNKESKMNRVTELEYRRRIKSNLYKFIESIEKRMRNASTDDLVFMCNKLEDIDRSNSDNNERVVSSAWSDSIDGAEAMSGWSA